MSTPTRDRKDRVRPRARARKLALSSLCVALCVLCAQGARFVDEDDGSSEAPSSSESVAVAIDLPRPVGESTLIFPQPVPPREQMKPTLDRALAERADRTRGGFTVVEPSRQAEGETTIGGRLLR